MSDIGLCIYRVPSTPFAPLDNRAVKLELPQDFCRSPDASTSSSQEAATSLEFVRRYGAPLYNATGQASPANVAQDHGNSAIAAMDAAIAYARPQDLAIQYVPSANLKEDRFHVKAFERPPAGGPASDIKMRTVSVKGTQVLDNVKRHGSSDVDNIGQRGALFEAVIETAHAKSHTLPTQSGLDKGYEALAQMSDGRSRAAHTAADEHFERTGRGSSTIYVGTQVPQRYTHAPEATFGVLQRAYTQKLPVTLTINPRSWWARATDGATSKNAQSAAALQTSNLPRDRSFVVLSTIQDRSNGTLLVALQAPVAQPRGDGERLAVNAVPLNALYKLDLAVFTIGDPPQQATPPVASELFDAETNAAPGSKQPPVPAEHLRRIEETLKGEALLRELTPSSICPAFDKQNPNC